MLKNDSIASKMIALTKALFEWAEKEKWKSFDPYDGGLSPIAKILPNKAWWVLQHCTRLSPINFRNLLGVKKQLHPKAVAHLLQAGILLAKVSEDDAYTKKARDLLEILLKSALWHDNLCEWPYPFPYVTRVLTVKKSTNIVNQAFIGDALLDAYQAFSDDRCLAFAHAVAEHMLQRIGYERVEEDKICFYYAANAYQTLTIHNANVLAARFLNRLGCIESNTEFLDLARMAIHYSIDFQRKDGLWHYTEKSQWRSVDCLHCGFILDSLMTMRDEENKELYMDVVRKGMQGFKQFYKEGKVFHFLGKEYPIDSRSCAQFIKTAVLYSRFDKEWEDYAKKSVQYVFENLMNKDKTIMYRKYLLYAIRTPFMRWSIAPMIHAFSLYLFNERFINE